MGLLDKLGNLLGGKKKDANILVVGLDNSGKSSIINNLKAPETRLSTIPSTVGFTVEKFTANGLNFNAYDMSGHGRYRNLWEHYYKEVDAIMFVIDSSDRMRLVVAKEELSIMLNHPELKNKNLPILFFSNKIDVKGACSTVEIRNQLELDKIRNKSWHIFASNALNGDGVQTALDWLVPAIKENTL